MELCLRIVNWSEFVSNSISQKILSAVGFDADGIRFIEMASRLNLVVGEESYAVAAPQLGSGPDGRRGPAGRTLGDGRFIGYGTDVVEDTVAFEGQRTRTQRDSVLMEIGQRFLNTSHSTKR